MRTINFFFMLNIMLGFLTSLFAASSDSVLMAAARAVEVNEYVKKETALIDRINRYIMETGDTTPTRGEIMAHFSLSSDVFTNYLKEQCTLAGAICSPATGGIKIAVTKQKITLSNSLGANPLSLPSSVRSLYQSSQYRDPLSMVSADMLTTDIPLSSAAQSVWSIKEKVDSNSNTIWKTTPPVAGDGTDTSKLVYVPNGDGTVSIYKWNSITGQWEVIGTSGGGSSGSGGSGSSNGGYTYVFPEGSGFDPNKTPCNDGETASVQSSKYALDYVCIGSKWIAKSTNLDSSALKSLQTVSGELVSLNQLLDRVTDENLKYFSFGRGSNVVISHNLFSSAAVKFNKGSLFWQSDSGTPVNGVPNYNGTGTINGKYAFVAEKIDDLNNANAGNDGDVAWLRTINNMDYTSTSRFLGDGTKPEAIKKSGKWIFFVDKLESLVTKVPGALNDTITGLGVLVDETRATTTYPMFYYPCPGVVSGCSNEFWGTSSYNGAGGLVVTKGSRSDLPLAVSSTRVNLTGLKGVEPSYTTTGVDSTYAYSASDTTAKFFKQWFYSTTGTITNNLLETYPFGDNAYNGTGASATARSIKYGLKNGIIAKYDGVFWSPLSDLTMVLDNSFSTWRGLKSEMGGVAGNGLVYTGTTGVFGTTYDTSTHFGALYNHGTATCDYVNTNMNTTNVCATRGMRLPTYLETQIPNTYPGLNPCGAGGNASGIPSHANGYFFISTASAYNSVAYFGVAQNNTTYHSNLATTYIRCVR